MKENIIIIMIVAVIVILAISYVVRAKKRGVKCIGCPSGAKCSGNCGDCSGNCSGCKTDHR